MNLFKKYFIPCIFVLPMITHWILPWGIETKLYISFSGVEFYGPDLLYIFYLLDYHKYSHESISNLRKKILIIISTSIIIYSFFQLAFFGIEYPFSLIINNLSFVWLSLVFLLAPLNKIQIQSTRPFMVGSLILLVAEILIFSLGIMHYTTSSNGNLSGQDFGGIMRISTTIGAATGTAVIIGLLGAICLTQYKWKTKSKIYIVTLSSLGVFFTMSRGTSLIWCLFLSYYFYKEYFHNYKITQRIKSIFSVSIFVAIFFFAGGFNPILNRYNHMEKSADPTAHRDSKFNTAMKMIEKSEPWGYGLGQVMPEKAIEKDYPAPHHFAPHNMYTLIAIELGWPGFILFSCLFIFLITGMNMKSSLFMYILLVFVINGNTESILLDSEYTALILFGIMTITKYKTKHTLYHESHTLCNET